MAEKAKAETIDKDGSVAPKRRFDARDWDYVAEYVIEEYHRRKQDRKNLEKQWKEIDRQIAMEPDIAFKKLPNGAIDDRKRWMAEMELPLQAQALEVLTADARRMLFPDSGPWFRAHAAMTDEYLSKVDFQSMIAGDEAEVPSKINQDNADKLSEGYLLHLFRQQFANEDFFTRMDRINAESFKYAMGVGRARMLDKSMYHKMKTGVRREIQRVPVLAPVSIKNLYLDDMKPSMHSVQLLEPSHIAVDHLKWENLQLAVNRGSTEPENEDGGWMPQNCKSIEPDKDGYVTVLEMEGDIVVPRKTVRSVFIPGVIVTVVLGGESGGKATRGVIRCRYRKSAQSSYLLFPYHYEGACETYPVSPLMKGRPVQMMATDALNRLMDSAMLKNAPPIGYDRTDPYFAQKGGPVIAPYEQWATTDPNGIKAHTELGGDPSALASGLTLAINLYAELTGVLPSRLGAQTVSHTTAFAKDAELQRGAVRTVDYVRQIGNGAMTQWLGMAYRMGREAIGSRETVTFFIDAYGGYVEVTRDQLAEQATFEWFGAGGPAEEQQKRQMRLGSLQLALQMDQLAMAAGRPPSIDVSSAQEQVLREGGWTDVDALIKRSSPVSGSAVLPPALGPGPATAALQQLGAAA